MSQRLACRGSGCRRAGSPAQFRVLRHLITARLTASQLGEQGGQLNVRGPDQTLEGRNGGWRGDRGGRDEQATTKLRPSQAVGDHCRPAGQCRLQGTGAGRRGGGINGGGDQRRREGVDGQERLQVDGRKRKRGDKWEMLMHAVASASGARHRCKGMSCPSWQWHRAGYRWQPVRTLPVAPLGCDLWDFGPKQSW